MTAAREPRPIEFPADEEWLEIVGHPRYLISTHARVYSTISRRLLSPFWSDHGHASGGGSWSVRVYVNRSGRSVGLAYHVLLAFVGKPAGDVVPGYLDGDRRNARLVNLAWRPRARPEMSRDHMVELARRGFAASPVAQAHAGRVENFRGAR